MAYHLEKSVGLDQAQLAQIAQLEKICNSFEDLTMKLNWRTLRHRPEQQVNDFLYYDGHVLVGYLGLYTFGNQEAEVSAMIHPDYRQQGIFKQLLAAARSELAERNIPDFLFICEQKSEPGKLAMQAIQASYEVSEYKMILVQAVEAVPYPQLRLRPAQATDVKSMAVMNHLCFGVPINPAEESTPDTFLKPDEEIWLAEFKRETIGKIHIIYNDADIYIAGFCIFPEQRNKGLGTAILTQIVAQLSHNGHKVVSLEVSAARESALSLYKRCGFAVTTAYDYYRLPVLRS